MKSKLEQLIEELCPDGVEYRSLEQCCNILDNKRKPVAKSERIEGKYPYYGANGIQDYVSNYIFDGTFVLVGEDGSVITKAGTPIVTWAEGKIWVNNHAHIIEETEGVFLRYLYHYIQTIDVSSLVHGNIPKLTGRDFKSLSIPVPPLEVQKEIVRILDWFTELTTELTTELAARQKQYEYYRDYLLTFDDNEFSLANDVESINTKDVKYMKLGDIATITRGGNFQKKDFHDFGKPCIHYGQIYTYYGNSATNTLTFINDEIYEKSKKARTNDIVMAVTSENIEDVCKSVVWLGKDDVAVSGHTAIIHHNQNSKYLNYYFSSNMFFKQKKKIAHGTKVIEVTPSALNNVVIPIPPIEIQNNIVSMLDRFDNLCNDLSAGLPAEIDARQKQYEYYRDALLSFDDNVCSQFVKVERERES